MGLEVAVLLILAAPRLVAVKVSILRFSTLARTSTHTIPDPILLSDNEYAGAESETDCSALDVDVRAKSDSDGDRFGSGAAVISGRLVTDHQEDNNNHNKGVVDKTQLRLSVGPPRSASPDSGSDIHQASKLQVDTDIMQESMSSVDLDVTKEWEDEGLMPPLREPIRTMATTVPRKDEHCLLFPTKIQSTIATFPGCRIASPMTSNPNSLP
jgi:hypothetical protein